MQRKDCILRKHDGNCDFILIKTSDCRRSKDLVLKSISYNCRNLLKAEKTTCNLKNMINEEDSNDNNDEDEIAAYPQDYLLTGGTTARITSKSSLVASAASAASTVTTTALAKGCSNSTISDNDDNKSNDEEDQQPQNECHNCHRRFDNSIERQNGVSLFYDI